jgi:hypothetical protein
LGDRSSDQKKLADRSVSIVGFAVDGNIYQASQEGIIGLEKDGEITFLLRNLSGFG